MKKTYYGYDLEAEWNRVCRRANFMASKICGASMRAPPSYKQQASVPSQRQWIKSRGRHHFCCVEVSFFWRGCPWLMCSIRRRSWSLFISPKSASPFGGWIRALPGANKENYTEHAQLRSGENQSSDDLLQEIFGPWLGLVGHAKGCMTLELLNAVLDSALRIVRILTWNVYLKLVAGGRWLKEQVTRTFYRIIAYLFATVLPTRFSLV